jgi:hypothetical protein
VRDYVPLGLANTGGLSHRDRAILQTDKEGPDAPELTVEVGRIVLA